MTNLTKEKHLHNIAQKDTYWEQQWNITDAGNFGGQKQEQQEYQEQYFSNINT